MNRTGDREIRSVTGRVGIYAFSVILNMVLTIQINNTHQQYRSTIQTKGIRIQLTLHSNVHFHFMKSGLLSCVYVAQVFPSAIIMEKVLNF